MQAKASSRRSDKREIRHIISVPNLFTTFSLFCGFLAVTLVLSGKYVNAAWLIFMAGILDAMDGRIARASGQSSEFGLQMDSLSDVVSSGLAPSILVYEYYLKDLGGHFALGLMLSFLPLLMATVRLARYNVMALHRGRKPYYLGLPAPSAATLLASIVILHAHTQSGILLRLITIMTPVASLAMISLFRYDGFPRFSIRSSIANRIKLAIMLIAMICMFIWPEFTLFIFILAYFLTGPINFLVNLFTSHEVVGDMNEEEEIVILDPPAEEPVV